VILTGLQPDCMAPRSRLANWPIKGLCSNNIQVCHAITDSSFYCRVHASCQSTNIAHRHVQRIEIAY
jgi:hypothetical protein